MIDARVKVRKKPCAYRAEILRLRIELACAYDVIYGFHTWYLQNADSTTVHFGFLKLFIVYHALTIGASRRFKKRHKLDGERYFRRRGPEVLQKALAA